MASHFIVLTLTLTTILFLAPSAFSQSAPGPAGPINLTDILVKGGQYTLLLRLLNETQVLIQLNNQLNNSNQGMTLLAPTDNAFNNLPAGTLNNLNNENKVKLALLHVLPKYYSMEDFTTVSNPVQTQAGGSKGSLGLNFTAGPGNQVNVSSGVVETRIKNPLRQTFPFAVYPVDKVLLPAEFIVAPAPKGSSKTTHTRKSAKAPSSPVEAPAPKGSSTTTRKGNPNSPAEAPTPNQGKPANAPSALAAQDGSSQSKNGGGRRVDLGVCVLGSIVMFCMAFL